MGLFERLTKGKKKRDEEDEKTVAELQGMMDNMLVKAADGFLDDEIYQKGADSIKRKFKGREVEYRAETLAALVVGMEMMLMSSRAGNDVEIPVMMIAIKLMQVEKDMEKMPKAKAE